jgi:hypothetical protein
MLANRVRDDAVLARARMAISVQGKVMLTICWQSWMLLLREYIDVFPCKK